MSVHGEFERYLRETLSALREGERADHCAWADEIEAAAASVEIGLEERARRVLASPLGRDDAWRARDGATSARDGATSAPSPLVDAADGLVTISRIILGR